MKLYHFTSEFHLPLIMSDGFLKLTESNIGSPRSDLLPYGEHIGPDVVWLTDLPEASTLGIDDSFFNKLKVRFTVEIEAESWQKFAKRHNINRKWYRILDETGGFTAKNWFISEKPIFAKDWLEIKK